jgi:hypothetical protein
MQGAAMGAHGVRVCAAGVAAGTVYSRPMTPSKPGQHVGRVQEILDHVTWTWATKLPSSLDSTDFLREYLQDRVSSGTTDKFLNSRQR